MKLKDLKLTDAKNLLELTSNDFREIKITIKPNNDAMYEEFVFIDRPQAKKLKLWLDDFLNETIRYL